MCVCARAQVRFETVRMLSAIPPFTRRERGANRLDTIPVVQRMWRRMNVEQSADSRLRCALADLYHTLYGRRRPACMPLPDAFLVVNVREGKSRAAPDNRTTSAAAPLSSASCDADRMQQLGSSLQSTVPHWRRRRSGSRSPTLRSTSEADEEDLDEEDDCGALEEGYDFEPEDEEPMSGMNAEEDSWWRRDAIGTPGGAITGGAGGRRHLAGGWDQDVNSSWHLSDEEDSHDSRQSASQMNSWGVMPAQPPKMRRLDAGGAIRGNQFVPNVTAQLSDEDTMSGYPDMGTNMSATVATSLDSDGEQDWDGLMNI